jgi:H/ACA ribonucleoprotein complex subunit 2
LKIVKKAAKAKYIKRGVKEVVKNVKGGKGVKGIVIIAGDISPIDVISHLPVLCEDNEVTYIYVPSKVGLLRTLALLSIVFRSDEVSPFL